MLAHSNRCPLPQGVLRSLVPRERCAVGVLKLELPPYSSLGGRVPFCLIRAVLRGGLPFCPVERVDIGLDGREQGRRHGKRLVPHLSERAERCHPPLGVLPQKLHPLFEGFTFGRLARRPS